MKSNYLHLLTEELDPQSFDTIIEEDKDTKLKSYFIQGPMIVSEARNKNKRFYKESIVDREVNSFMKVVQEGTLASGGELGHPQTPEINMDRISHYIEELTKDRNIHIGKARVATTPFGTILKGFLIDGKKPGMSTRGLGSVNENGEVGNNFKLVTIDAVTDPSGPNCFVSGILENRAWYINESGGIMEASIDQLEKDVEILPLKSTFKEEHLYSAMNNFLERLKTGE